MYEKLLAYATLISLDLISENDYYNHIDNLFIENPQNDFLIDLEWEKNIANAIIHIETNIDYTDFSIEIFGKTLMYELKEIYKNSSVEYFSKILYNIFKNLPTQIKYIEPFHAMSYADDPLSYGDYKQSKYICEYIINYYNN